MGINPRSKMEGAHLTRLVQAKIEWNKSCCLGDGGVTRNLG
jgi:hypothetical protein